MPFFGKQNYGSALRASIPIAYGGSYMATMNKARTKRMINTRQGDSLVDTQNKRKRIYGRPSFKNQLYNTMAAKHDSGEQGVNMTHNTVYTLNLTSRITQGDGNGTRDGDAIVLSGLKMKGFYNTHTTANAYSFRIIIGYSGEEYSNTTFGSGLGISEIFLPNTASLATTKGQINPKAFTVLYDETLTANSQLADVRDRVDYSLYVPLNNKLFNYQASASTLGKDNNLYVVIMSDVILGSPGITLCGGTTVSWDFIFKNAN